jgi:hypothetical protein
MFKRVFQHVLSASLLFTAVSISAAPITYEFGYTFGDVGYEGMTVTGTFKGEEELGLITVVSDILVSMNGADYSASEAFGWNGIDGWTAPAVVSADRAFNNFAFGDFSWLFSISGFSQPQVSAWDWYGWSAQDSAVESGDWFVRPVTASVPEAGATALLLFSALSSAALLKRRFSLRT